MYKVMPFKVRAHRIAAILAHMLLIEWAFIMEFVKFWNLAVQKWIYRDPSKFRSELQTKFSNFWLNIFFFTLSRSCLRPFSVFKLEYSRKS